MTTPMHWRLLACQDQATSRRYEYRHVVDIEETSHAGNVHDVSCARWQGRCRELFLLEHIPALFDELRADLRLLVTDSGCVHLAGIRVFDEVVVRMRVAEITRTQISLVFDHLRVRADAEELAAVGWQHVACMRGTGLLLEPAPVPESLRTALHDYTDNRLSRIIGHPTSRLRALPISSRRPITIALRAKEIA